jgi:hypothetical protein
MLNCTQTNVPAVSNVLPAMVVPAATGMEIPPITSEPAAALVGAVNVPTGPQRTKTPGPLTGGEVGTVVGEAAAVAVKVSVPVATAVDVPVTVPVAMTVPVAVAVLDCAATGLCGVNAGTTARPMPKRVRTSVRIQRWCRDEFTCFSQLPE